MAQYINKSDLARELGKDVRTINRMLRLGLLSPDGKDGKGQPIFNKALHAKSKKGAK